MRKAAGVDRRHTELHLIILARRLRYQLLTHPHLSWRLVNTALVRHYSQSCLVQVLILDHHHHQALGESMMPGLEQSSRTLQYWRIVWDVVILGESVE